MDSKIEEYNFKILDLLSVYLNNDPTYIKQNEVERLTRLGISNTQAFATILSYAFNMDIIDNSLDKEFYHLYFKDMIHLLNVDEYKNNPYIQKVPFKKCQNKLWELKYDKYKPYEGFVCDDIEAYPDGRRIPQIGYFNVPFTYPCVYQNGRMWMSVTPNEINTMKEPILKAQGNVLTYGLGLGYFAFMVSNKENVNKVTIIEKDPLIIHLFQKEILPYFPNKNKIEIINADALDYAKSIMDKSIYDFVFADIWHDVQDGLPLYTKLKALENKKSNTIYEYWIEKTLLCYKN